MIKQELIDRIAIKADIPKTKAAVILDCLLEEIPAAVARGEDVVLRGFGTFSRTEREARVGRNPRTGEAVNIPARPAPKFVASPEFKRRVEQT